MRFEVGQLTHASSHFLVLLEQFVLESHNLRIPLSHLLFVVLLLPVPLLASLGRSLQHLVLEVQPSVVRQQVEVFTPQVKESLLAL